MLFSNTDGRTYAKETPRSVLLDICSSWNTNGSVCSAGSGSRAVLTRSATWCQRTGLSVSPAAQPGPRAPKRLIPTTRCSLLRVCLQVMGADLPVLAKLLGLFTLLLQTGLAAVPWQ